MSLTLLTIRLMMSFAISAFALPTVLLMVLTFAVTALYYKNNHKKEEKAYGGNPALAGPQTKEELTSQIMQGLTDLGCQPEIEGDNILVKYQGQSFIFRNNAPFTVLWYLNWAGCLPDDPAWPDIIEAINNANGNFPPTVIWNTHPETSEYVVSTNMPLLLLKNMEEVSGYLQYVLNVCIEQRNYVDDLVRKSLSETKPKKRHNVGFTFNDENAEDERRDEATGTDERTDGDMAVAAKAGSTL